MMKKIIVIGCSGAGKSHFSRALQEKTGLPLYHLDMLYWNKDKTTVEKSIFLQRVSDILCKERWILDGNYASTMEMRLAACDTVVFLDYPCETCLDGVRQRRGKPRSDMPWVETEEDEELIAFIKVFEAQSRPRILELLSAHRDKSIIVLKDRGEAEEFLRSMG